MNCWAHITHHAVEQFISRWEPAKSAEQATEELAALLSTSTKLNAKTPLGDSIYVSGHRPEVRMVIKDRNVCVTVLPPGPIDNANVIYVEEMEELNRLIQEENRAMEAELNDATSKLGELTRQLEAIKAERHDLSNKIDRLKRKLGHFIR